MFSYFYIIEETTVSISTYYCDLEFYEYRLSQFNEYIIKLLKKIFSSLLILFVINRNFD